MANRLNVWTVDEENLLRSIYPSSNSKSLDAAFPNRSLHAIKTRATKLKLLKAVGCGKKKKWSAEEIEYLKIHYPVTENKVLMGLFNCSEKSLYSAASVNGLKKTDQYISEKFGAILKRVGAASRFKKGNVSFNKGKKQSEYMTAEAIDKTAATRFKTGQKPHNTVEVGFERITKDGYIEVKIGDFQNSADNFKLKHRLVWEENNGPVPEGFQVRFIDGNRRNFELSNLKLMSFEESLQSNTVCDTSIVKRFLGVKEPEMVQKIIQENPGVISLKRNSLRLNKQIKQHERKN